MPTDTSWKILSGVTICRKCPPLFTMFLDHEDAKSGGEFGAMASIGQRTVALAAFGERIESGQYHSQIQTWWDSLDYAGREAVFREQFEEYANEFAELQKKVKKCLEFINHNRTMSGL